MSVDADITTPTGRVTLLLSAIGSLILFLVDMNDEMRAILTVILVFAGLANLVLAVLKIIDSYGRLSQKKKRKKKGRGKFLERVKQWIHKDHFDPCIPHHW